MARTIMTLDKSYIDLIVNGNAFGLTINQIDGDTIKVSGMLENGATFIIDGIDTINTIKAPKEQLPKVKPSTKPVESSVKQIELPMQIEEEPVVKEDAKPNTAPKSKQTTTESANKITRRVMKEKSKEIMNDLAFAMLTQEDIAKNYGVSLGTINRFYRNNKDEIEKMRRNKAEENLDAILKDLAKGTPVSVVADKYSIPQGTIHEVYADNLDKVKSIKMSIMNVNTRDRTPEPEKANHVPDLTPTRSSEETFDTKERTYYPGKINESFSIDSDTEASIISQLIDDIPIVKIAKDFDIPRERVQKVYFDNKDYICRSRESRIRRPKSSMTNNTAASKDSLENLIKSFANR